jgi:hypothetical protein
MRRYPDNSDIFTRKLEARRARATLSFAEKLQILDNLRERVAPITASKRKQVAAAKPADKPRS